MRTRFDIALGKKPEPRQVIHPVGWREIRTGKSGQVQMTVRPFTEEDDIGEDAPKVSDEDLREVNEKSRATQRALDREPGWQQLPDGTWTDDPKIQDQNLRKSRIPKRRSRK